MEKAQHGLDFFDSLALAEKQVLFVGSMSIVGVEIKNK